MNPFLQWWFTPKLPKEHIFVDSNNLPEDLLAILGLYLRRWLIHPLKRRVAKLYLLILQRYKGLVVVGVTGSAGKTSVKEMLLSVLSQNGETVASYKNIDPVYNIPTTILRCRPSTKYLILEMSVEYQGEMDYYLWLARPTIGILTNIFPTHIQHFGDKDGVGKEKSKLIKSLSKDGTAILNNEDTWIARKLKNAKAKTIWYGAKGSVKALDPKTTKNFETIYILKAQDIETKVSLPVIGQQFVSNSLAAAAAGLACKLSIKEIKKGLEKYSPPEHRMRIKRLGSGALIVDDSYNSNPSAARKTLETFKNISKGRQSIAVLGDMLELGDQEEKYHRELGKSLSSYKIDYLVGVGSASRQMVDEALKDMSKERCFWANSVDEALPILKSLLKRNSSTLIKGSRSMNLDKLVSRLS